MSDVDTGLEWLDSWVASVNAPTQSAVEQSIRGTFPRVYRRIGLLAVPDEFLQFTPAEIRRHAGSVDGVADAVQTARGAVHEVAMDTQAYGQLCQFLPTILSQVSRWPPVHSTTPRTRCARPLTNSGPPSTRLQ